MSFTTIITVLFISIGVEMFRKERRRAENARNLAKLAEKAGR